MCRAAGAAMATGGLAGCRGRSRPPRTAAGLDDQFTRGRCQPPRRPWERGTGPVSRRCPCAAVAARRSTSASSGNAGASAAAAAVRRAGGATVHRTSAADCAGRSRVREGPGSAAVHCSRVRATSVSSASTSARSTGRTLCAAAVEQVQPGERGRIADLDSTSADQLAEHRGADPERGRKPSLRDAERRGEEPHAIAERAAVQLPLPLAVAREQRAGCRLHARDARTRDRARVAVRENPWRQISSARVRATSSRMAVTSSSRSS
ncbi:MAG: hypothetical protein K0R87_1218 [Pseudonocardia sp.]|nr:hypothetical protein [Pseudonocardia sp.]